MGGTGLTRAYDPAHSWSHCRYCRRGHLYLGAERAQAILEWWSGQGPLFIRLGAGIALVLGGFIAYALTPGRSAR